MDNSENKKEQSPKVKEPRYAKGIVPKKHWINLFDILIILLIIAAILVAVFHNSIFSWMKNQSEGKAETISCVLEFKHVDASLKNSILTGDTVYLVDDSLSIGTVSRVETVENSYEIVYDPSTGEGVKQYYPDNTYVDITIVISCDVRTGDTGYYVEDVRLAMGAEYDIKTSSFTGQATCIALGE